MLKQTHKAGSSRSSHVLLYDRVRDDIFDDRQRRQQQQQHQQQKKAVVIPSITTIALLQLQAYTIQLLTLVPSNKPSKNKGRFAFLKRYSPFNVIRQTIRWILLISLLLLDNVARILNVESEMTHLVTSNEEEDTRSTACDTYLEGDDEEEEDEEGEEIDEEEIATVSERDHDNYSKIKLQEQEQQRPPPPSLQIRLGTNTHDFHEKLMKKPSYRDIHDQCRSSEPSTPTFGTAKRCSRPCCETSRNTSKSGAQIQQQTTTAPVESPIIVPPPPPPSSSPNSPTPSFVAQHSSRPSLTPRTRKISSPSAIMTTSTSTSTSSYHQPHHILKISADSSPVLGPLLRPGTRHTRSLSNNMVLPQKVAIESNKKVQQQQQQQSLNQTLRRINAQREIAVQNNNNSNASVLPPTRNTKKSLVPNILKKKPTNSHSTATTSSSESSTTKDDSLQYLKPKLQKSLSTATENHNHNHHHHNHHDHHQDHQYTVKTMGELLQENPLIRKDLY